MLIQGYRDIHEKEETARTIESGERRAWRRQTVREHIWEVWWIHTIN